MAGFLRGLVGGIVNAAAASINPYKIQSNDPERQSKGSIADSNDCLTLYRQTGCFEAVLYNRIAYPGKSFSLFRLTNEGEAYSFFRSLSPKLVVLYRSSHMVYQETMLQQLCDCIRAHPTWTVSHVSAHANLTDAFHSPEVSRLLNVACSTTGLTPLMVAVMAGNQHAVHELLNLGARLDVVDGQGNTAYHLAVQHASDIIVILGKRDQEKSVINWLNGTGQSAIHLSCSHRKVECTEALLLMGADVNVTACDTRPIHAAMKVQDIQSAKKILEKHPDQLHVKDGKYGGTPLHWAKTKEAVDLCLEHSCDVNVVSRLGDTALHVMLARGRLECISALFCHGTDVNTSGKGGNTALHLAVLKDDIDLVQGLLVFGADFDTRNDQKQTARHLVATSRLKNRDAILFILHMVGAQRCATDVKGCLNGCVLEGQFHGTPDDTLTDLIAINKNTVDDVLDSALSGAHSMTARSQSMPEELMYTEGRHPIGDRVLCLDGGGIRGLVLIQILLAIERAAGRPIKDCFDWVGGTSTGGILALGIAIGKPLQQILGMYFGLKDKVFVGSRPYPPEPLEQLLKKEFGESVKMSDIKHPKVLVTGVLADRFPPELHMFRSYVPPVVYRPTFEGSFQTKPPLPDEQAVWQAARCSGAAPTYFRACGPFLDGGLMSNNPTLDILTEIHEYNIGLRTMSQAHQVRPLGVVVSLGTGKIPIIPVKTVDVFKPGGIFDAWKSVQGVQALWNILLDQATVAEGRPNDRARAWCSMVNVPYFRFSPHLSEDVPLDAHDDKTVVKMMWETQCYLAASKAKILKLGSLLAAKTSSNSACSKK